MPRIFMISTVGLLRPHGIVYLQNLLQTSALRTSFLAGTAGKRKMMVVRQATRRRMSMQAGLFGPPISVGWIKLICTTLATEGTSSTVYIDGLIADPVTKAPAL
jgi:hypothetical protein